MIADDFSSIAKALAELNKTEEEKEVCPKCGGGGWVEVYSEHPPSFLLCDECYNPEDLPCP